MIFSKPMNSPRIQALQKELEQGNGKAFDEFLQNVTAQGAPLVEPIEDTDDEVLITFLWVAEEDVSHVIVATFDGGFDLNQKKMIRLLDTNLWYKTYQVRNDLRMTYRIGPNDSLVSVYEMDDWEERTATWQLDPFNSKTYDFPSNTDAPDEKGLKVSLLELPAAPAQPWVAHRENIPRGRVETFYLKSEILGNERKVWIYTPPEYHLRQGPYALLLLFDGWEYTHLIPTPTILDNLIADGRIPPLIAIMLDSGDHETRHRELACYPPFAKAVAQELLPWAHTKYSITSNPAKTIVAGVSLGGLAATFIGFHLSHLFGNVLSQSGSFFWKPEQDLEYEWLAQQLVSTETLPLNFYLEAGLLEIGSVPEEAPHLLVANRHMRNLLQAKGYQLQYTEYNGGHEFVCWQGTLANGLITLVGNA